MHLSFRISSILLPIILLTRLNNDDQDGSGQICAKTKIEEISFHPADGEIDLSAQLLHTGSIGSNQFQFVNGSRSSPESSSKTTHLLIATHTKLPTSIILSNFPTLMLTEIYSVPTSNTSTQYHYQNTQASQFSFSGKYLSPMHPEFAFILLASGFDSKGSMRPPIQFSLGIGLHKFLAGPTGVGDEQR